MTHLDDVTYDELQQQIWKGSPNNDPQMKYPQSRLTCQAVARQ